MGFDRFLFADYSGAADPGAQRRAIALWTQARGGRPEKVPGPFTREGLRKRLLLELREASARGQRVLFGIDHQWSWPLDLWKAAGLAERPWREALRALVLGGEGRPPLGPPSRFPAAFNAFAGAAIFHCRVKTLAVTYGVPCQPDWRGEARRITERAMAGAKPATRLGGIGAVAGQTLLGLKELHLLLEEAARERLPLLAWPFDALQDDGHSHVGLEVYPGAFNQGPKSDDADARACCEWADREQREGRLDTWLDLSRVPDPVRAQVRLEGWILSAEPSKLD